MHRYLLIVALILAMLAVFTGCASAGTGKLVGLSHGFVTIQGVDALHTNPAAVGGDGKSFELHLNGQGSLSNNAVSSDYFKDMENIEAMEEEIKDDILTNLAGDPLTLRGRGVQGLDLKLGSLSVFAGAREVGSAILSADIVDLILNGYTDGSTYDFSGSGGDMALYSDLGINYSRPLNSVAEKFNLKSFRIGGTAHYLSGAMAVFGSEGGITVDESDPVEPVSGDGLIEGKYSEKGTGYAFDLGVSAAVNDSLSWGVSVMNIGSISGSDPRLYRYEYDADTEKFIKTEDAPLDSLKYKLPLEIKAGAKLDLTGMVDVYGDLSYISYDSGEIDQQYAVGTEISVLKFMPFRLGARYSSLQDNFVYSGGAGLYFGPFRTSIGISDLSAIFDEAKSVSLAVDTAVAF